MTKSSKFTSLPALLFSSFALLVSLDVACGGTIDSATVEDEPVASDLHTSPGGSYGSSGYGYKRGPYGGYGYRRPYYGYGYRGY